MAEEQDWDLWAVVRSCKTTARPLSTNHETISQLVREPSLVIEQTPTDPYGFLKGFESRKVHQYNGFDELSVVYTTFQATSQSQKNYPTKKNNDAFICGGSIRCSDNGTKEDQQEENLDDTSCLRIKPHEKELLGSTSNKKQCRRCEKKRKPSWMTIVLENSENPSEVDPWQWHRYGRKTLKGSAHVKTYYKCNSDGNKCLAKKQVEKSEEYPGKLKVSYIGVHNHSPKNIVAGLQDLGGGNGTSGNNYLDHSSAQDDDSSKKKYIFK